MSTYRACPSCANVLANADTSGIPEESLPTVEASIEAAGLLALTAEISTVEYFDCWFCDDVCMDTSTLWSPI